MRLPGLARGLPGGLPRGWRVGLAGRGPATAAPTWPAVGATVPALLVRAAAGAVAGVLALVAFPGAWTLAVVVAVLVAVWPTPVAVVAVVLVVAGVQVLRPLAPVQPGFFVALAGVHLLHVLTALARVLPWRAQVQLRVLARPLGRFAVVQAGAQAVAVVLLAGVTGPRGGLGGAAVPVAGALGGAVLLVLALVLLRPLLQRPPR